MSGKATPEHAARLDAARQRRLGLEGYIRIVAALRRKPMLTAEVAQAFGLNHNTAAKVLRWLRRYSLIHRSAWVRLVRHSRLLPVWSFGGEGDIPNPQGEAPAFVPPRGSAIMLGTVAQLLTDERMTIGELAGELAMHEETAARVIRLLRDHGLSHIEAWIKPATGVSVAQHVYGPGRDAKRPKRIPIAEQRARHSATFAAKAGHQRMIFATAGFAQARELQAA